MLNAKEEKSSKLCAICKTEMEFVVFHTSMFRFDAINVSCAPPFLRAASFFQIDSLDRDEASGICFFNSDSRDKFEDLLKETAPILTKVTFQYLLYSGLKPFNNIEHKQNTRQFRGKRLSQRTLKS